MRLGSILASNEKKYKTQILQVVNSRASIVSTSGSTLSSPDHVPGLKIRSVLKGTYPETDRHFEEVAELFGMRLVDNSLAGSDDDR